MRKELWFAMVVWVAALVTCAPAAHAGEVDLLVQKLVDKGVLSANEGQILLDETKQQVAKQNATATNDAIPLWIQTTKIKGDTRLRFEGVKDKLTTSGAAAKYVTHERLRVRLGLESKVNDQMKVGIGIATGKTTDPRSRNISLGNSTDAPVTGTTATDNTPASGKNILLDYAYADWSPSPYVTITGGKFQNPIWSPWDMIWKGDITPEGAAVKINYPVNGDLQLFFNNLDFVLRNIDTAGSKQPGMYAVQPGFVYSVAPWASLKGAVAYYQFENLRGNPKFSYSKGGNTLDSNSNYKYNYNSLQESAELGIQNHLGAFGELVPYFAVFGDYIYDLSASGSSGRGGFDTGVKFGYEKVADWKQWQGKLATSKIGHDAWVDAFTDSDRYQKGKTNTQSYEGVLEYGLGKNTSLVLDYYYSFLLPKQTVGGHLPEQVVQVDWNLKF